MFILQARQGASAARTCDKPVQVFLRFPRDRKSKMTSRNGSIHDMILWKHDGDLHSTGACREISVIVLRVPNVGGVVVDTSF